MDCPRFFTGKYLWARKVMARADQDSQTLKGHSGTDDAERNFTLQVEKHIETLLLPRSQNHSWNAAHESQAISLEVPKMLEEEKTQETDLWSIYKRINQSQMRFTTEDQSQSSDL